MNKSNFKKFQIYALNKDPERILIRIDNTLCALNLKNINVEDVDYEYTFNMKEILNKDKISLLNGKIVYELVHEYDTSILNTFKHKITLHNTDSLDVHEGFKTYDLNIHKKDSENTIKSKIHKGVVRNIRFLMPEYFI